MTKPKEIAAIKKLKVAIKKLQAKYIEASNQLDALEKTTLAKDELIGKLVAKKRVEPRPGYQWVQMPIRAAGNTPIKPVPDIPEA